MSGTTPQPGEYLATQGVTFGAQIILDGQTNIPTPDALEEDPPKEVGAFLSGGPCFMGLPDRTLTWAQMDTDEWQALFTLFNLKLNLIGDQRRVSVLWPDPDQAGQYVTFDAFLSWPSRGKWENGVYNGCSVKLLKCRQPGQGDLG